MKSSTVFDQPSMLYKFGLVDFIDELNDKFGDNIAENQILSNTIPMKHEQLNFLANMDYKSKWPERY